MLAATGKKKNIKSFKYPVAAARKFKNMIAEITKILPAEKSINGNNYIRVMFKLDGGGFAKTDICPDYRNYARWKKLLKVGNRIGNLIIKNEMTIDADSYPVKMDKNVKSPDLNDMKEFSKNVLC